MSVPFSNTHLRVPRGFGTILEGLAREVLRDQPEDIPEYAAQYFERLLKQREDSGMDPAEWAAKLEDRFYNNHAFKTTGPGCDKETKADMANYKEKSYESITQLNFSEEVNLTESTEVETGEEEHITVESTLSGQESVSRIPEADLQSDELSRTEEEKDPAIVTPEQTDSEFDENENSLVADPDIPHSESTDLLSSRGFSNVDVCAQELGEDTGVVGKENSDSEEEEPAEVEEPVEVFPYSGLAGVDASAPDLGGMESKMDKDIFENDTYNVDKEQLKLQTEENLVQSSLSQSEIFVGNHPDAEDQAEITEAEEEPEAAAPAEETLEGFSHIESRVDSGAIHKEDLLAEFTLKSEDTAMAAGQKISGTKDGELEMKETEQELNAEGEETESYHETSEIMTEKVDTNESNLNDSEDDEKRKGVKNISSSHQPTRKADEEDETNHQTEDKMKICEDKLQQNQDFEENNLNDTNFTEDETTHTLTEDYSEMKDEEIDDGEMENLSSQVAQSNLSTPPLMADSETVDTREQDLLEERRETQRSLVASQPEDTIEEKEVTSKGREDCVDEGTSDSEIQEKSDAMCEEESISLTHSADGTVAGHQEEERPLGYEKDGRDNSDEQEECSRPQEEEDIMDIPLDDPEANRAAAKIQAGFRGHMTRKKLKPEDKAEGEEVSSTGDVLNGSQGDTEAGGSGAVERNDTSVPEQ